MVRAIIHDLDGMLISGERFSDAYIEKFGIDPAPILEFFEGPYKECIIGKADLKEELAKGWLRRWKWHGSLDELLAYWWKQGATFNHELTHAIKQVRASGTQCFIATNQEKYRITFLRNAFDLENLFDKVFISSELGCTKPQPAFFDRVMQYLNADHTIVPQDVMFWDDKCEYVEGAQSYGFTSHLFTGTDSYIEQVKPQRII